MLEGMLQVKFHGADVDPEADGNFAMRKLLDMSGEKYVPAAGGQFGKGLFQFFELDASFGHHGRVWAIIGNIGNCCNFGGAEKVSVTPAAVFCDVDGGPEDVVRRASDGGDLGRSIDPQESLMQSLPGKVGRSEAAG